jgi:hypothetical protein
MTDPACEPAQGGQCRATHSRAWHGRPNALSGDNLA